MTQPCISAILAMSENRVIGKNNQLPWHLAADLIHFKTLTTGHPIIMGRKTFTSIGKPLPNRTNIILTRDCHFKAPGCVVVTTIDHALECGKEVDEKEVFVIGGAEIYHQCMPFVNKIYLTLVHTTIEGDTFFPELNQAEWKETACVKHEADEKNAYDYSFITLEKA